MEYQKELDEFNDKVLELIELYGNNDDNNLPAYEIVARLIANAVSLALFAAPNELGGVKTIHACIEMGITEYEKTHS